MNPSLILCINNWPPSTWGESTVTFHKDTGGYQVNFPPLIRKAKAFPEVSQWANTVTCPTIASRQAENIPVCPASMAGGGWGEGQQCPPQPRKRIAESMEWACLHFNRCCCTQSLPTIVSVYTPYQRAF